MAPANCVTFLQRAERTKLRWDTPCLSPDCDDGMCCGFIVMHLHIMLSLLESSASVVHIRAFASNQSHSTAAGLLSDPGGMPWYVVLPVLAPA